MMKTAIALGVLVALAGCSKPAEKPDTKTHTVYYAITNDGVTAQKRIPRGMVACRDRACSEVKSKLTIVRNRP